MAKKRILNSRGVLWNKEKSEMLARDLLELFDPDTKYTEDIKKLDRIIRMSELVQTVLLWPVITSTALVILIYPIFQLVVWLTDLKIIDYKFLESFSTELDLIFTVWSVSAVIILVCFAISIPVHQSYKGLSALRSALLGADHILLLRSFSLEESKFSHLIQYALRTPEIMIRVGIKLINDSFDFIVSKILPFKPRDVDAPSLVDMICDELDVPLLCVGTNTTYWGPPKITVQGGAWERLISESIPKASLILIIPSNTHSTKKEIEWALDLNPESTIFIMLPKKMHKFFWRYERKWSELRESLKDKYDLPPYNSSGMIFTLERHGHSLWRISDRYSYSMEILFLLVAEVGRPVRKVFEEVRSGKHRELLHPRPQNPKNRSRPGPPDPTDQDARNTFQRRDD